MINKCLRGGSRLRRSPGMPQRNPAWMVSTLLGPLGCDTARGFVDRTEADHVGLWLARSRAGGESRFVHPPRTPTGCTTRSTTGRHSAVTPGDQQARACGRPDP